MPDVGKSGGKAFQAEGTASAKALSEKNLISVFKETKGQYGWSRMEKGQEWMRLGGPYLILGKSGQGSRTLFQL